MEPRGLTVLHWLGRGITSIGTEGTMSHGRYRLHCSERAEALIETAPADRDKK